MKLIGYIIAARNTNSLIFILVSLVYIILVACSGGAFNEAKKINSIDGYDQFLIDYPESKYSSEAKMLRENLSFDLAKNKNSVSSYDQYLAEYPDGKHLSEAKILRENLSFDLAKNNNSVGSYDKYLEEYPNGKFVIEAKAFKESLVFNKTKSENSIQGYKRYLEEYKYGSHREEAVRNLESLMYSKAMKNANLQDCESYLEFFPNGKYSEEIKNSLPRIVAKRIFVLSMNMYELKANIGNKYGGFKPFYDKSPNRESQMDEFRNLLSEKTDLSVYRIADFDPPHIVRFQSGGGFFDLGSKGSIVPSDEEGMTLIEYLRTTNQLEALNEVIKKHPYLQ